MPASLAASILSFLALPPWIIFMYSAWPRTKGMRSASQRSASQYQANMHSAPTTRSVAEGCDGVEEGGGRGGQVAVEDGLARGVEDVGVQDPGVQIDAAVESVLAWL